MSVLVESLVHHWRELGECVRPGVDSTAITAFERRYNLALPLEIADLYRATDGIEIGNQMFELWPLAEFRSVTEEWPHYRALPKDFPFEDPFPDAQDYYLFADVMYCFHYFAVRMRPDAAPAAVAGPVLSISKSHFVVQDETWGGFWDRYMHEPDFILRSGA